jgi:hypothetical protein
MRRSLHPAFWHRVLLVLAAVSALRLATPLHAAPTPGFVETWPGTSLQGWGGGSAYSNPGAGGLGGGADGFLVVSTPMGFNLGAMSSGPEYTGNWQAAGVLSVRVWLNDIGTDNPLEIHFGIGTLSNFWQYNVGFLPPSQSWQEFVVDLSSSANWTQIVGAGTFDSALQTADRVLFRHDVVPYVMVPDQIQADLGIDNLHLSEASTPARSASWGRIKSLYR